MPFHDPIVEEVHEARRRIMERFDNDFEKYFAHLMERQHHSGFQLIASGELRAEADKAPDYVVESASAHEISGHYDDPIVEEVHEARRRIMERFDNDLGKYFAYLQERRRHGAEPTARVAEDPPIR